MIVVSNSGNIGIITFQYYSSKQLQFLLLLFFLLTNSATPLTFNISSFPATDNTISLEGNANIDGQALLLTETEYSAGRASYHQSFLLRENTTRKLADFTTSFTFVIDTLGNNSYYADGLAFFLAPEGSLLNFTVGSGIGFPVDNPQEKPSSSHQYPFVAVEFDIFRNYETSVQDPAGDHVGIDVNSVKSLITKPWNGSVVDAMINNASISYDSGSKNLSIAFTSYVNGSKVMRYLAYKVDLEQYLPERVIVGFCAATGQYFASFKILSWSFNSTSLLEQNAAKNTSIIPATNPSVKPKSGNAKIGLQIVSSVGGSLILIGALALIWFLFRKKTETGESSDEDPIVLDDSVHNEFEKGTGPRKFSYNELAQATNNFEKGEKLGEGGFGGVYRGFIKDLNSHIAVKKIARGSKQGLKEYAAEIRIISRLRHRNLVQLIGWCHEKRLLLVYELMPNGSLDSHLFKDENLLIWEVRYKIAQGLASGLYYLHEEWEQCVLHRDIKSSNVMLDSNFNAKLGDFGLARLVDHGKLSQTTIVAGTRGYMALEYVTTGKASKQSDVYSFGVVALEIACGRKPIDLNLENSQVEMVEWVWGLYGEGKIIEAADPKLCGDFDEKQMECLMMVGLWCAHPDYNMRPSMQQAIQVLTYEVAWPVLPLEMPMATFPQNTRQMLSTNNTGSEGSKTESSYYGGYSSYSSQ
ncbi:L-type lectin-domain containing receptor kinase IX.1-like [Rosa rugosa]|uniref:L-type lectin-domain containing receptor kinase IX.1-like n=1 Tax=Rosa rugosa TaxID=74645 RepID=UPI002B4152BD|nr:L-type lectin-domain containing receptor kinase IX.1-like [Rosa rugosa]